MSDLSPAPRRRPNVIFFFTDQQRWDSMAAHGNPLGLTPNLDRLAQAGTHCFHHVTCQPVCGPARSCLQTGRFATASGCYRNGIALPPSSENLGECFRRAGYQTAYIGKWHLGTDNHQDPGPVAAEERGGYDYWLASNLLEFTSDAYRTRLWDRDNQPHDLPGYRADACVDAAIRYVDSAKDDPFFLFLSLIEPHHQNHLDDYPPPAGYREEFTGRWTPPDLAALGGTAPQHLGGYWGMIKRIDEALGRLLDALRSLRILEDTIVVFTSDHACHFKTRNGEYKRSCHESSIRVPCVIHGGAFTGGGRIDQLTSLIDLPPTLLAAAGIHVPASYHGRSLVPLVAREPGAAAAWPDDVFVQISEDCVGRAVRTRRWKYAVTAPKEKPGWDTRPWAPELVETHLYDLECDPYELTNLVHSRAHAPVRERLRQRLLAWMERAGEELPTITPAEEKPSGQRIVEPAEVDA